MLLRPPSLFFSSLSYNLFISGGQVGGHEEEEEVVVMMVVMMVNGDGCGGDGKEKKRWYWS